MPDKKISQLDEISSVSNSDVLPIVDVSDGTAGTTKKITMSDLGTNLTTVSASNITTGTLSDSVLSANVTLEGNTFNGSSQLVKLDSSSKLPVADGSQLTNLDAGQIGSGTLPDARLSTNVTLKGNTFNGASQLVELNGSTQLPAVDGSQLTDLNASNIASGTLADARLSANVTLMGNTFNSADELVQLDSSGNYPGLNGAAITDLNASNVATGTLNDNRLSNNITKKGNTFNGSSQLVELTASAYYPALNGSLITDLNANNVTSGTINNLRLSGDVMLNNNDINANNQIFFNYKESLQVVGSDINVDSSYTGRVIITTNAIPITLSFVDGLPQGFNVTIITMGTDYITLAAPGVTSIVYSGGTITSAAPHSLTNTKGLEIRIKSLGGILVNTYVATGDI